MEDTPLTDAKEDYCRENEETIDPFNMMTDHARHLERENAYLKNEIVRITGSSSWEHAQEVLANVSAQPRTTEGQPK